ncbi:WEB family protein At2g40480-like [Primulina eburnea]|uniref:WEB family protein At2g40480-like n=1 Tax=Primulina eburnea TaxID=1245227 RepID=UPI003C6C3066
MEETSESAALTETKKIVNPRVEIDTSPPFESVKEAVDRFGGSGPWIPNHLLRLAADPHDSEDFDVNIIGEQAAQLEKDLIIKEQETLDVLKQLEAAKRFVSGLKLNFMPELSSFFASPDLNLSRNVIHYANENLSPSPQRSTGSMFLELDRAKLNLNKTSIDLALIQESVESLNKKMRKDKSLLERTVKIQVPDSEGALFSRNTLENYTHTATEPKRVDFETEQFKKMTEASRYEVMKAMAEIERTKNSIKMAEMRLNAAKKMEEAAKAIEAIAIYEKNTENSSDALDHTNRITLSCEEYRLLTQKAQQVDQDICKTKFIDSNTTQRKNGADNQSGMTVSEKLKETKQENKLSRALDLGNRVEGSVEESRHSKFKFRNSRNSGHRNTQARHENGSNGTTSMGDILGRRVMLQDNIIVGNHVETHIGREHASLSHMLREQSRLILHPGETTGDGNLEKSYVVQRKKFGFIQVPLSIKKTKKRTQPKWGAIYEQHIKATGSLKLYFSLSMAHPRKRVYGIRRGADGSAFLKCENCGLSVAIALADMHDCGIKKNVTKKLKSSCEDVEFMGQRIQDQPRSAFHFFMDEFMKDFEEGNKVEIHKKGYEKWTKMTKKEREPFVLVADKLNSDYVKLLILEESEIQVVDDEADSAEVGKYDPNYMNSEMYYDSDSSGGSGSIGSEKYGSFDSEDLFQARPWLSQPEN